ADVDRDLARHDAAYHLDYLAVAPVTGSESRLPRGASEQGRQTLGQNFARCTQCRGLDVVADRPAAATAADQPQPAQDTQVLRYHGVGDAETFCQATDRYLGGVLVRQLTQEPKPDRVAKRPQKLRGRMFRGLRKHAGSPE